MSTKKELELQSVQSQLEHLQIAFVKAIKLKNPNIEVLQAYTKLNDKLNSQLYNLRSDLELNKTDQDKEAELAFNLGRGY